MRLLFEKKYTLPHQYIDAIKYENVVYWRRTASTNPRQTLLISGSSDRTIRIWDLNHGFCVKEIQGYTETIHYLKVFTSPSASPSEKICCTKDRKVIKLWNFNTRCLNILHGHTDWVSCLLITNKGDLISGSFDHLIKIWDIRIGRCKMTLIGHMSCVSCLHMMSNEECLVSGSRDNIIKIWSLIQGICVQTLYGHTDWVNSLLIIMSVNNEHLISSSSDNTIRVWDLDLGKTIKIIYTDTHLFSSLVLLPTGELACSSKDNKIKIFNLTSGTRVRVLNDHSNFVMCLLVLPTGELVSGSWDRTIKIWCTRKNVCIKTLNGHTGWISSITYLRI
jgi:WD40 repeat protein